MTQHEKKCFAYFQKIRTLLISTQDLWFFGVIHMKIRPPQGEIESKMCKKELTNVKKLW